MFSNYFFGRQHASASCNGEWATGRAGLALVIAATLLGAAPAFAGCEPSSKAEPSGTAPVGADSRAPGQFAGAPGHVRAEGGRVADLSAEHVVAPGDNLTLIGARYGIPVHRLAELNGLDARRPLRVGQRLLVCSRHIAPQAAGLDDGIVVNLPQRMVFLLRAGRMAGAWPIAVGRPDWPTPTGDFTVKTRETDKTWYVPKSIQEEMRREGKPVLTEVPPGPDNPLGRHWIGLSLPAIGIHGTNAPASVYGFRSHGCIRMQPDHVAELFERIAAGERGRIVYQPLLLARDEKGRIWFEANPDVYRRGTGTVEAVRQMARERGIAEDSVDWTLVAAMLRDRDGQARQVGLGSIGGNR